MSETRAGYRLRSPQGNVWNIDPEGGNGEPTTLETAQQIADDFGWELLCPKDCDAHVAHCLRCGRGMNGGDALCCPGGLIEFTRPVEWSQQ